MKLSPLTPEQLREQRLEHEARVAKENVERARRERTQTSGFLIFLGLAFLVIGAWLLISGGASDEVDGRSIVNLQALYIGQTAGIVGAIFFAVGLHLRNIGER